MDGASKNILRKPRKPTRTIENYLLISVLAISRGFSASKYLGFRKEQKKKQKDNRRKPEVILFFCWKLLRMTMNKLASRE